MLLSIECGIIERHSKTWEMLKPMSDNNNNHKNINGNSNISDSDNITCSRQLLIQYGGYGNLQSHQNIKANYTFRRIQRIF
jgi:hypothetical protein